MRRWKACVESGLCQTTIRVSTSIEENAMRHLCLIFAEP
jgi:hypothetical protein